MYVLLDIFLIQLLINVFNVITPVILVQLFHPILVLIVLPIIFIFIQIHVYLHVHLIMLPIIFIDYAKIVQHLVLYVRKLNALNVVLLLFYMVGAA